MQQEYQMDVEMKKQFNRIVNSLDITNWGANFRHPIAEKMMAGIKEFIIPGDDPYMFGKDRMEVKVIIGSAKNDPTMTVLKGLDVSLTKEIKIPSVKLQEDKGNILVNVPNLDERLSNPPTEKTLEPGLHDEFAQLKKTYDYQVNRDMQILMLKLPDVFNLLQAKHNVNLTFSVPSEHLTAQAKIIADSHVQNIFSSYFNLTPKEVYGMLRHGQAVHKKLFVTKKDPSNPDAPSRTFNQWIKPNFKEKVDGSFKMEFVPTKKNASMMEPLKKYNLLETEHEMGVINILHEFKKGGIITVTNLNPQGERHIRIGADPGPKMRIKIWSLDGKPIYDHNAYLKQGMKKEIGEFVTLPIVDYRQPDKPINTPGERPIKTIVVSMNQGEEQPKQNETPGEAKQAAKQRRQLNDDKGKNRKIG